MIILFDRVDSICQDGDKEIAKDKLSNIFFIVAVRRILHAWRV